jgi:hypothetical protein
MQGKSRAMIALAVVLGGGLVMAAAVAEEARPPSERELRTAMNRAESRFFDLYNQVNEDSRHRMTCDNEERAGSRLRGNRSCRTRGESEVSADAAKEYLRGLNVAADVDTQTVAGQSSAAMNRDFGGPVAQATTSDTGQDDPASESFADAAERLREERLVFERHLAALTEKHPELKQRLDEYLLARARYEAARGR